jgi:hypothetical protein
VTRRPWTITHHYTVPKSVASSNAALSQLLVRWAIVWLPLFLPMSLVALLIHRAEGIALISAFALLLLWVSAAVYAVAHPHRGLHDRLAGTWVVRR